MSFRFRKRLRFGPFAFNLSKNGLSSVSIGRPGASINIPVARSGGTRTTAGIPGTGLSWTQTQTAPSAPEARQVAVPAPEATSTQQAIEECVNTLDEVLGTGEESIRDCLWHQHGIGLIGLLNQRPETSRHITELTALVQSEDRCELHLRRATSADDAEFRLKQIGDALQDIFAYARESGIYQDTDEDN